MYVSADIKGQLEAIYNLNLDAFRFTEVLIVKAKSLTEIVLAVQESYKLRVLGRVSFQAKDHVRSAYYASKWVFWFTSVFWSMFSLFTLWSWLPWIVSTLSIQKSLGFLNSFKTTMGIRVAKRITYRFSSSVQKLILGLWVTFTAFFGVVTFFIITSCHQTEPVTSSEL